LSIVCVTHAVVGAVIEKGATSALKAQGARHSRVTCMTHVSLGPNSF
jgi:hypothetical protein